MGVKKLDELIRKGVINADFEKDFFVFYQDRTQMPLMPTDFFSGNARKIRFDPSHPYKSVFYQVHTGMQTKLILHDIE